MLTSRFSPVFEACLVGFVVAGPLVLDSTADRPLARFASLRPVGPVHPLPGSSTQIFSGSPAFRAPSMTIASAWSLPSNSHRACTVADGVGETAVLPSSSAFAVTTCRLRACARKVWVSVSWTIMPIAAAQGAAMTTSAAASATAAASMRSLVRTSGLLLNGRLTGNVMARMTKLSVAISLRVTATLFTASQCRRRAEESNVRRREGLGHLLCLANVVGAVRRSQLPATSDTIRASAHTLMITTIAQPITLANRLLT